MATKKERPEFVQSLLDTVQSNGTLLTGIACFLILFTGMTLVNNPSQWWIAVIAVLGFGAVIFLFTNARVIIKVAIVVIILSFTVTESFQYGSILDQFGAGGLVWMSVTLFTFFSLMAYSYATSSGASRWSSLAVATIIGYISTFSLGVAGFDVKISAIFGMLAAAITFIFLYKFTRKTRFSYEKMPTNLLLEKDSERILEAVELMGWEAAIIEGSGEGEGGIVVWKDYAYFLYPVKMNSPFSEIGKKKTKLGYEGKDLNPWLISVAFKEAPLWKSAGANITVALLDLDNMNGKADRVIGVGLPDTKKKIPVGVFPSNVIQTKTSKTVENISKLIDRIDVELSPYSTLLTDKQKIALSRINKTSEKVDEETLSTAQDDKIDVDTSKEKISS